MRIGLREISPLRSVIDGVLAEDAQVVGKRQQLVEMPDGVVDTADTGQRIDIPEGANEKSAFGEPEIVIVLVTVKKSLRGQQLLFERGNMVLRFLAPLI